jgi:predicted exporter
VQQQQENHALLAAQVYRPGGIGPQLMDELGFPPALAAQRLAEFANAPPPLGVEQWLADAVSMPYRDLWLGADANGHASIVSLSGIRDFAALRALSARLPGVQFVDRVAAVSELLGHYRRLALLLLAAAYVVIGGAMALRYGIADAARLLAAPMGAALLTAGVLGASGALNLFHVLGLFLVLGLGVDYAVFLREGAASRAATVLAITLSTVGAALSYGLLAFSATPFIRAIGLTLLIGVGFTYLLALLLQRPPAGTIHREAS